jgi:hypothetical protein
MYVSNVVREAWSIPCVIELEVRALLHILFSYIHETVRRKKMPNSPRGIHSSVKQEGIATARLSAE